MSLQDLLVVKHAELCQKAKLKELTYTVEILKCKNHALEKVNIDLKNKLKAKQQLIAHITRQLSGLQSTQTYRVFQSRINIGARPRQPNKQGNLASPEYKLSKKKYKTDGVRNIVSEKEIECPEMIGIQNNPFVQFLDKIEEIYDRHLPEQPQLKNSIFKYIQSVRTKTRQEQVLAENQEFFSGLSDHLKSKTSPVQTFVRQFTKGMQQVISDSDSDFHQGGQAQTWFES